MSTRKSSPALSRHDSSASRREQELCRDALDTGQYDELTDQQWVAMCERIARESAGEGVDTIDAIAETESAVEG